MNPNIIFLTPIDLAMFFSKGKWECTEHLCHIAKELIGAVIEGNKRIIVNLPPRHGKSEFISKYFIFWYLMLFRNKQVLFSSYDQQFANIWGRKVRDLIEEWGNEFYMWVRKDVRAADYFQLIDGGGMTSVGAGGSLTGRGADLLIIDDPIKNDTEANSEVQREALWNWFNSTAYTRLEPEGTAILIMTRWHEDDICGRIIQRDEHKDWLVINIPAIAEEDDVLGRKVGEPLWSKRYNIKQLEQIRNQLGEHWFNCMYQQNPSPSNGKFFKRKNFRYYDDALEEYVLNKYINNGEAVNSRDVERIPKKDCSIFATTDLAVSTNKNADWTVCLVFAVTPKREVVILDVIRDKIEGSEHLDMLREVHNKWGPSLIGIESVQYQQTLVQMARKAGLPVKELKPTSDKYSRALPIAALLDSHSIYFPKGVAWLSGFERELLAFPNGKNDDQVDAFAYINQMLLPLASDNRPQIFGVSTRKRVTDRF